jgi:hypothetical protein
MHIIYAIAARFTTEGYPKKGKRWTILQWFKKRTSGFRWVLHRDDDHDDDNHNDDLDGNGVDW